MEELEKLEEGKNEVPAETSEATQPELDSNPIPTEEEKIDAGMVEESDTGTVEEKENEPESVDAGEVVGDANVSNESTITPDPEPEPEKTFTQSQVNDMIGKTRVDTRNKTFEYIYGRYGVNDEAGLDDLVGNAQRFDSLKSEYDGERANWKQESDARNNELLELKEKVALMESGIDRERYDDAKFILKGKGMEINAENIAAELSSHPEWKKEEKVYTPKVEEPASQISVLGNEKVVPEHTDTEEDYAMDKLFKVR